MSHKVDTTASSSKQTTATTTTADASSAPTTVQSSVKKKNIIEIVEQDTQVVTPAAKKSTKSIKREVAAPTCNNTDKPGLLMSKIKADAETQLMKDSQEVLHGFHLNGRDIKKMHQYTRDVLQDTDLTKLLLVRAPIIESDGTDLTLQLQLYIKWSDLVFGFLGQEKPEGNFLAFIQDRKNNNIYMPCCHDVKPIPPKQLLNHFKACLASKADGSKCAFCNSTDLVNNTYTTVNARKEHIMQNLHLNSIYLVLNYTKYGLQMVDVRTADMYLVNRPFANYFLRGEGVYFTYSGLIDFLKSHVPTQVIERTPLFSTLYMYKRKAINNKQDKIKLPCEDCDNSFSTYTGFNLGIIFELKTIKCQCGADNAFELPLEKIDEVYGLAKAAASADNTTAGKSLLLQLFSQPDSIVDTTGNLSFDINIFMKNVNTNKQVVITSGSLTTTTDIPASDFQSTTLPTNRRKQARQSSSEPKRPTKRTHATKDSRRLFGLVKFGEKTIRSYYRDTSQNFCIPEYRVFVDKLKLDTNDVDLLGDIQQWYLARVAEEDEFTEEVAMKILGDMATNFIKK